MMYGGSTGGGDYDPHESQEITGYRDAAISALDALSDMLEAKRKAYEMEDWPEVYRLAGAISLVAGKHEEADRAMFLIMNGGDDGSRNPEA